MEKDNKNNEFVPVKEQIDQILAQEAAPDFVAVSSQSLGDFGLRGTLFLETDQDSKLRYVARFADGKADRVLKGGIIDHGFKTPDGRDVLTHTVFSQDGQNLGDIGIPNWRMAAQQAGFHAQDMDGRSDNELREMVLGVLPSYMKNSVDQAPEGLAKDTAIRSGASELAVQAQTNAEVRVEEKLSVAEEKLAQNEEELIKSFSDLEVAKEDVAKAEEKVAKAEEEVETAKDELNSGGSSLWNAFTTAAANPMSLLVMGASFLASTLFSLRDGLFSLSGMLKLATIGTSVVAGLNAFGVIDLKSMFNQSASGRDTQLAVDEPKAKRDGLSGAVDRAVAQKEPDDGAAVQVAQPQGEALAKDERTYSGYDLNA